MILWSILYSLFSAKVSLLKYSYILVKTLLLKQNSIFTKFWQLEFFNVDIIRQLVNYCLKFGSQRQKRITQVCPCCR